MKSVPKYFKAFGLSGNFYKPGKAPSRRFEPVQLVQAPDNDAPQGTTDQRVYNLLSGLGAAEDPPRGA